MAKLHFVKSARKDNPNASIKIGDSYYWWQHAFRAKQYSKTQPTRSQMQSSDFLAQIYAIEDEQIAGFASGDEVYGQDELQGEIDDIIGSLEDLKSEQEDKRSNMPESLQSAPSGEMLQGRADSLDEMISELQSIDTDIDEELKGDDLQERIDEIKGEVQNVTYNGE